MRPPGILLRVTPAAVLILLLFPASPAHAAPGALDAAFGPGGTVTTPIGLGDDVANAVAVQPDGKIVVAGESEVGTPFNFALARYNPDGSLDPTFDTDGRLTTAFAGSLGDYVRAVAIQPDGKIVAAGYSIGANIDFALARYNPDGSLDTTFDTDGRVITPIGTAHDFAYAMALQPDGKIVLAGHAYDATGGMIDFALARYNPDGSLDTTFDTDGRVITDVGTNHDYAYAVAIQPDGRIVAVGYSLNPAPNADFSAVRYNPDGSLDTTFDTDGKVITAIGPGTDAALAVALQPDGKIVAAGYAFGGTFDFALVRYNPNGSLDTTFDTDGRVTTSIGANNDFAYATALQPDGKIVAAGYATGTNDLGLARYNPNGSLDTTFDTDGTVITAIGPGDDRAYALALQADGKIIAAGYSYNGADNDFALARYDWTTCTQTGSSLTGTSGPDVLCGTTGNDSLSGLGGNDILIGNGGNDGLAGGKGNDALLGGTGADTATFQDSGVAGSVNVDLSVGTATNAVLGSDTILRVGLLSTVENVTGGPGADSVVGDPGRNTINGKAGGDELSGGGDNDTLIGGTGEDVLFGEEGNDQLLPGPGADEADGGAGIDTLRLTDVTVGVVVSLTIGGQTSDEDAAIDGFESLIGTPLADTLIAQLYGVASILQGTGGQDILDTTDGDNLDVLLDNQGAGQSCTKDAGDTTLACT